MKTWSLKWRILLPIGLMLVLGIGFLTWLIARDYSRTATFLTERRLENLTYRYANQTKAELELSFGSVKALAAFLETDAGTPSADRERYVERISRMVLNNPNMVASWTAFEPDAFDGRDKEYAGQAPLHDQSGRFVPYVVSAEDGSVTREALKGYDKPGEGDYYLLARNSGREVITTPYPYMIGGREQLITSVAVPVRGQAGKVVGVAGGDLLLEGIGDTMNAIRIYETGYAFLVDHRGVLITHPQKDFVLQESSNVMSPQLSDAILQTLEDGQPRNFVAKAQATGQMNSYFVSAFPVAGTGTNWAVVTGVPVPEAMAEVRSGVMRVVVVGFCVLAAALSVVLAMIGRTARVLHSISRDMMDASQRVALASGQITSASGALAEGATEQAASLEETSSALEEMASMTRQNADNAARTSKTTIHTVELIDAGGRAVGNMTKAMTEISESADQIRRIIKTIEEIAFQTNLLALNAAVEAARAGEAGKGFAVVADEVRNLAQRSAQAARDTAGLIERTVARVRHGSEIAAELDSEFREIDSGAQETGKLIGEISTATNEQAQGVDQVNTAVAQMDKVTQQNAASAEECASAADELSAQARTLKGMVDDLVVLVAGASRPSFGSGMKPPSRPAVGALPAPARRAPGMAPTSMAPRLLAAPAEAPKAV